MCTEHPQTAVCASEGSLKPGWLSTLELVERAVEISVEVIGTHFTRDAGRRAEVLSYDDAADPAAITRRGMSAKRSCSIDSTVDPLSCLFPLIDEQLPACAPNRF